MNLTSVGSNGDNSAQVYIVIVTSLHLNYVASLRPTGGSSGQLSSLNGADTRNEQGLYLMRLCRNATQ